MSAHVPKLGSVEQGAGRRFAVIGAGAMGLSLAAMLGQCHQVTLVVRDRQRMERLHRDGVRVGGLIRASAKPSIVSRISQLVAAAPLESQLRA